MSIGLDDLNIARKARRKSTATVAAEPVVTKDLRSTTARPWSKSSSAGGLGRSRKRPDYEVVMNEDSLSVHFATANPFTNYATDPLRRAQQCASHIELRLNDMIRRPLLLIKALRRYWYL